MTNEVMKCLDCGTTEVFIMSYIDREEVWFDENGDVLVSKHLGRESYDDDRIVCGLCGSDNLNIYEER